MIYQRNHKTTHSQIVVEDTKRYKAVHDYNKHEKTESQQDRNGKLDNDTEPIIKQRKSANKKCGAKFYEPPRPQRL